MSKSQVDNDFSILESHEADLAPLMGLCFENKWLQLFGAIGKINENKIKVIQTVSEISLMTKTKSMNCLKKEIAHNLFLFFGLTINAEKFTFTLGDNDSILASIDV